MLASLDFFKCTEAVRLVGQAGESWSFANDRDTKGVRNLAFKISLVAATVLEIGCYFITFKDPRWTNAAIFATKAFVALTGLQGDRGQRKESLLQNLFFARFGVIIAGDTAAITPTTTNVLFYATVGAELLTRVTWWIKGK